MIITDPIVRKRLQQPWDHDLAHVKVWPHLSASSMVAVGGVCYVAWFGMMPEPSGTAIAPIAIGQYELAAE